MSSANYEHQLLSLPESDRIHLLEVLWESLVSDELRERTRKWALESERRLNAVERGQLPLVDADQVIRDLHRRLGQ